MTYECPECGCPMPTVNAASNHLFKSEQNGHADYETFDAAETAVVEHYATGGNRNSGRSNGKSNGNNGGPENGTKPRSEPNAGASNDPRENSVGEPPFSQPDPEAVSHDHAGGNGGADAGRGSWSCSNCGGSEFFDVSAADVQIEKACAECSTPDKLVN